MRWMLQSAGCLVLPVVCGAQSLSNGPKAVQQVTVEGRVIGALTPGGRATLTVDVTPKPGMRVYAPGAKDFTAVAIVMTPNAAVTPGPPSYPASELDGSSGAPAPVPVYRRAFRIVQPIRVQRTAKAGQSLTLSAAVNYQACDDRLCYPASSIPVIWSGVVEGAAR